MNGKRIITFTATIALVLSACGGGPAVQATATAALTDTPAAAPTNTTAPLVDITAPPEASATAAATGEASATPQATRPPNAADCTNSAAFVADVTIPDNTELTGGQVFTKTWRIQNTGTCIWAADYTLIHYSDERMEAPAAVPLPVTYPGQTADVSVELAAPNSVGTHRANFVIKNTAGAIMKIADDSRLWLIIKVTAPGAATAAPTAQATQAVPPTAAPTAAGNAGGAGLVTASCGYTTDQSKLIELLNAINTYRTQSGLFAYPINPKLAQAAQSHASDMACNGLTGHTGSNGSNIAQRVAASGYVAAYVEENIHVGSPTLTGQQVVEVWINAQDPKQKLNLVSDTYIEIGVGYASFNNGGYYVIVFASP